MCLLLFTIIGINLFFLLFLSRKQSFLLFFDWEKGVDLSNRRCIQVSIYFTQRNYGNRMGKIFVPNDGYYKGKNHFQIEPTFHTIHDHFCTKIIDEIYGKSL
jgi:hypothetical protein